MARYSRPKPWWEQWPYAQRNERDKRVAYRRTRVKGGRWFVMKMPPSVLRGVADSHKDKPWKAFNRQNPHFNRYFATWREAHTYATDRARAAQKDKAAWPPA